MDCDSAMVVAQAGGYRDMDVASGGFLPQTPECRAGLMAEGSRGRAGKYGGHPLALASQIRAANGVYASIHGMEPSLGDPPSDRLQGVAERDELEERDDPMLFRRQCPGGTGCRVRT